MIKSNDPAAADVVSKKRKRPTKTQKGPNDAKRAKRLNDPPVSLVRVPRLLGPSCTCNTHSAEDSTAIASFHKNVLPMYIEHIVSMCSQKLTNVDKLVTDRERTEALHALFLAASVMGSPATQAACMRTVSLLPPSPPLLSLLRTRPEKRGGLTYALDLKPLINGQHDLSTYFITTSTSKVATHSPGDAQLLRVVHVPNTVPAHELLAAIHADKGRGPFAALYGIFWWCGNLFAASHEVPTQPVALQLSVFHVMWRCLSPTAGIPRVRSAPVPFEAVSTDTAAALFLVTLAEQFVGFALRQGLFICVENAPLCVHVRLDGTPLLHPFAGPGGLACSALPTPQEGAAGAFLHSFGETCLLVLSLSKVQDSWVEEVVRRLLVTEGCVPPAWQTLPTTLATALAERRPPTLDSLPWVVVPTSSVQRVAVHTNVPALWGLLYALDGLPLHTQKLFVSRGADDLGGATGNGFARQLFGEAGRALAAHRATRAIFVGGAAATVEGVACQACVEEAGAFAGAAPNGAVDLWLKYVQRRPTGGGCVFEHAKLLTMLVQIVFASGGTPAKGGPGFAFGASMRLSNLSLLLLHCFCGREGIDNPWDLCSGQAMGPVGVPPWDHVLDAMDEHEGYRATHPWSRTPLGEYAAMRNDDCRAENPLCECSQQGACKGFSDDAMPNQLRWPRLPLPLHARVGRVLPVRKEDVYDFFPRAYEELVLRLPAAFATFSPAQINGFFGPLHSALYHGSLPPPTAAALRRSFAGGAVLSPPAVSRLVTVMAPEGEEVVAALREALVSWVAGLSQAECDRFVTYVTGDVLYSGTDPLSPDKLCFRVCPRRQTVLRTQTCFGLVDLPHIFNSPDVRVDTIDAFFRPEIASEAGARMFNVQEAPPSTAVPPQLLSLG